MIFLRVVLYLICIFSFSWSILIFGGPTIIKRVISGYTLGTLAASGITVSPALGITIARLDFSLDNELSEKGIEGFSRAAKLSWSIFGEKPFLKLHLGPSVLKNHVIAESIVIYTPPYREIDWQNIFLSADSRSLSLNSFGNTESVKLEAKLNLESAMLSNIMVEAEALSSETVNSVYSANSLTGQLNDLDLNLPPFEQFFSGTFAVKDINASNPSMSSPIADIKFAITESAKTFEIDLNDVNLSEFGGFINNVKVNGNYNRGDSLQDLQVDFLNGSLVGKSPTFSSISMNVRKTFDDKYKADIEGELDQFEIYHSDNFFGVLPSSNFLIDLELHPENSKVAAESQISLGETNISGALEMEFRSEPMISMNCSLMDCALSDFALFYKINFDKEWVSGNAVCTENPCVTTNISHFVKTSNTNNIFKILNQTDVLNPLSTLYLYGVITSGQKINGGHELKL